MSVCLQLGMPSSNGLFQRAIIESGPCNGYKPLDLALNDGATFVDTIGCANLPSDAETRFVFQLSHSQPAFRP
jgi:para-nitrobenzyl esterase